jgi:uncharacterized protein YybS (DUF2232 family)
MLAEVFFWAIVIYLIYKIVFGFVVPVSQAGKQMKQQFQNMHEHMQQQNENFRQQNQQPHNAQQKSKNVVGDYIDFEEVKK